MLSRDVLPGAGSKPGGEPGVRPTIRSVADALGVSTALVSLALNGKKGVSDERRDEIIRTAAALGYSPSPAARALRSGKSRMHGLIVRNFVNPLFNELLSGMQDAAYETGHVIVALDSDYSTERELLYMRNLAASRVGALAIAPIGGAETVTQWQSLMPNTPTVLINADGMPAPDVMHVAPDSVLAVSEAFKHLHSLGHRQIAFLCAPEGLMADSARLEAYFALCDEYGVSANLFRSELDFDSLVNSTLSLLDSDSRPTALIANSDYAAHAIYTACRDRSVEIGAELSIVGHDDLSTSALLDPPLTTLRLDRRKLGREVFLRLDGTATGDHYEPVHLVERGSTAPLRNTK